MSSDDCHVSATVIGSLVKAYALTKGTLSEERTERQNENEAAAELLVNLQFALKSCSDELNVERRLRLQAEKDLERTEIALLAR